MDRSIKKLIMMAAASTMICAAPLGVAMASSHREAPAIAETPKLDGTDFYMFRSYEPGREGYVTLIANYQPLQAPYGGPNYFTMDQDAIYEIHIDNDGDAIEDLTFQFDFDNALENGTGKTVQVGNDQAGVKELPIPLRIIGPVTSDNLANVGETETYTLTMIEGDRRMGVAHEVTIVGGQTQFTKPIDNIGEKSLPEYGAFADQFIYEVQIPGCDATGKVFVGQRAEAFAVNLGQVFDLVNLVPLEGALTNIRANDEVVDEFNVTSLALELPISCITNEDEPVIGAWTTASLPQAEIGDPTPSYENPSLQGGAFVQVSRLSAPLVNEIVIGLPFKDLFNASEPKDDAQFADFVTNPTFPFLIDALFRQALGASDDIAPNNFPRNDLVAAFLTGIAGVNQPANVQGAEMMRLNTQIPPTPQAQQHVLGVLGGDNAGFPNGRRPVDDVVDIELRVAMGALCYLPDDPFCTAENAPVGDQPFIDGAPTNADGSLVGANELRPDFPYLNTPIAGASNNLASGTQE